MRVLGVTRLSRERDESTSIDRQRESIEQWARSNGHTVVGWVEDIDVSGTVAPWLRPSLGEWLPSKGKHLVGTREAQSRADEFDILACWRLDRVSRRVVHTATLIDWLIESGKDLVSATEGFSIRSPMGQIFVAILSALAQGELEAIRERTRNSFQHLVKEGRWRGGFLPYGYQPRIREGGGFTLEIDVDQKKVLDQIVSRLMNGATINSVVRWLNEEGIPTSLDAQRIRNDKEGTNAKWRVGNLGKMLRSPTLLGFMEIADAKGDVKIVRDADGMPMQRAKPLLSQSQFDQLQSVLEQRRFKQTGRKFDPALLLRVIFCSVCDAPLYRNAGRGGKLYYRCGAKAAHGTTCENTAIRAEETDAAVTDSVMAMIGALERFEKRFVPGNDNAAELAAVEEAMSVARDDRAAGLYGGARGTEDYRRMYAALEARREALVALPSRSDEWADVPTGQTIGEHWEGLATDADRNALLRSLGLRVTLWPVGKGPESPSLFGGPGEPARVTIDLPPDLRERARLG